MESLSVTEVKEKVLEEEEEILEELRDPLPDWQDAQALQQGYTRLWRRFRDELVTGHRGPARGDLLWAELPADPRCPDHSIWDHLRITTALAFLPGGKAAASEPTAAQSPWLLRLSLRSVQSFIDEARSSRDLWVGSFLLADLIWHAMQPLVKRYGHDCILHPDLRGNPLVDHWLAREGPPGVLPQVREDAVTYAALLPATFTAVVPHGAPDGHLKPLAELAEACQGEVERRWRGLAKLVRDWLLHTVGPGAWEEIWERQHAHCPIRTFWSALVWRMPEPIRDPPSLLGRALPVQRPDFRPRDPQTVKSLTLRKNRLAPWVPAEIWAHYEWARSVYGLSHLGYLQNERGFDYALTHHQLGVRHALLKAQVPDLPAAAEEPGEKCTCCGRRQALTNTTPSGIVEDRQGAREFWSPKELDPDETGSERLCGVCAVKRFLIEAGEQDGRLDGLNRVWAGAEARIEDIADRDRKLRVPFPSTATIAAQTFIERVLEHRALKAQVAAVVRAHRASRLPATSFPRALPRLAALAARSGESSVERDFLEREAQETLFPQALQGRARYWQARGKEDRKAMLEQLAQAVGELRRAAAADAKIEAPDTRIAVVMMDGDSMGSLLLGDPARIQARWRDVIHPLAIERMRANPILVEAGWPDLFDARRLIGPALHAYISRALAHFSHTITPWVVERELSGRLIYSGGDELLCLVPGNEALALAARLQQLFAAPWIVDTAPAADAWAWRRKGWQGPFDPAAARRRFVIPRFRPGATVRLPITDLAELEPHVINWTAPEIDQVRPVLPVEGPVLPVLGAGQSLSAGIAYGHFKTPLRRLRQQARHILEHYAKERAGRGAVGLSHYSRNGLKSEFAMPWGDFQRDDNGYRQLVQVVDAFESSRLSAGLPYKLRESAAVLGALPSGSGAEAHERLSQGLFEHALGGRAQQPGQRAALALWRQGLKLFFPKEPERAVEGLLLCRALAAREGEPE